MSTATFLESDTTTQGTWINQDLTKVYGSLGYSKFEGSGPTKVESLPTEITSINYGLGTMYSYGSGTVLSPDLQRVSDRTIRDFNVFFYSALSIEVIASGVGPLHVSVYFQDDLGNRSEHVEIRDLSDNVLDGPHDLLAFQDGIWLRWTISGSFRIYSSITAGSNAIISGIFFDAPFENPLLTDPAVSTSGTTVTATLSKTGCVPSTGSGGFTLSGTSSSVSGWSISGTTLTLSLSGKIYEGETISCSYDRSTTTDDIADSQGNFLQDFSGVSVTNNSTQIPSLSRIICGQLIIQQTQTPSLPLLRSEDVQLLGAFRVPSYFDGIDEFSFSGGALAYDSTDNTLFITGHYQGMAQITIPETIVNSSTITELTTASLVQSWAPILSRIPNPILDANDGVIIGGIIPYNGTLICTAYAYYSGANGQTTTFFIIGSKDLANAPITGMFALSGAPPRAMGGYTGSIPTEWQSVLGGKNYSGLNGVPINDTASAGPSFFAFDPATIATNGTAYPEIYYPADHPLGPYIGPVNLTEAGATSVGGTVFLNGTSSVLYFGIASRSWNCYGTGDTWGDPWDASYGPHALNGTYISNVWAYNAQDLAASKQGNLQPWLVMPYDEWSFDYPLTTGKPYNGGVAYDPVNQRIYVVLKNIDTVIPYSSLPLIYVFQVTVPPSPRSPLDPRIAIVAATPATVAPGNIPSGMDIVLTAANVFARTEGSTITNVSFYLDSNTSGSLEIGTDTLLGVGTPSGNLPTGGSNTWVLTIPSLGSGSYRVFARATDSDNRNSNVVYCDFIIS